MVTYEKASRLLKILRDEYSKEPFALQAIGIAKVGYYDPKPNTTDKESYALGIYIPKALPAGVSIPAERDGVKLYVKIGEFRNI